MTKVVSVRTFFPSTDSAARLVPSVSTGSPRKLGDRDDLAAFPADMSAAWGWVVTNLEQKLSMIWLRADFWDDRKSAPTPQVPFLPRAHSRAKKAAGGASCSS